MLARTALLLSLVASATAFAADRPGCKDPSLFPTRMPGYRIVDCKVSRFDGYEFFVRKGPKHLEEGKLTFITYEAEPGQTPASGREIVHNYENAIAKIDGTVAASDPERWVNGKVVIEGHDVWFQVEKGGNRIWLRVVEKTPMQQLIVADAAALKGGLDRSGHMTVDGIFFDTNKATLKPESGPALEQIAKLLDNDPALKLWVVGHTDWVGGVDDNVKLSQARATAVVEALTTTYRIAPARLKGVGMGPYAPLASNGAEEGRARNRRVEVVQMP